LAGKVVAEGGSGFGDLARLSGDTILTAAASGPVPTFWVLSESGGTWDGSTVSLDPAPLLAQLALRGSLGVATVPPTASGPSSVYLFELR
jgi:hypothetical protein